MIDGGEVFRKLLLHAARFSMAAPIVNRYLGGVGAILMLHRVSEVCSSPIGANTHLRVTPAFLDAVLSRARRLGYRLVSMDDALERLAHGGGERFVAITADDAYRDNLVEALPVLEKHEAPLTIYVAPGLIQGDALLWWDVVEAVVGSRDIVFLPTATGIVSFDCATAAGKLRAHAAIRDHLTRHVAEEDQFALVRDLALSAGVDPFAIGNRSLMDWDELRGIAGHPLVTIGAHTVHHHNLRRLAEEKVRRELTDAVRIIEKELDRTPRHLAYPYGFAAAVGPREVVLAREAGFASAVTTRHGLLQAEHAGHLHALPRISMNGRYQRVGHVGTMLSGITTPMANRGRRVVTV